MLSPLDFSRHGFVSLRSVFAMILSSINIALAILLGSCEHSAPSTVSRFAIAGTLRDQTADIRGSTLDGKAIISSLGKICNERHIY